MGTEQKKKLEDYIVTIPDFPKPGIMFRDVTSALVDPEGFRLAVDSIAQKLEGLDYDLIAGIEARGFIFAAPLAYRFGKGTVAIRKKGKLPRKTVSESYTLEYGVAEIEAHVDSVKPGQKVVIVDDLLATGGSTEATARLVEKLGGEVVKIVTLIELKDLHGREKIAKYPYDSCITYAGE